MLKKSPFYDFLSQDQASDFESILAQSVEDEHYINWNGRLMPMHYGDAEREYRAIRETCAVCDCDDNGSLMDDAVFYKFADDEYFLLPSDIDHTPYFESICARYGLEDVSFEQCAGDWAGLAIQGPRSAAAVVAMGFHDAENMKPFEIRSFEMDGTTVHLARVGYTADLGYECWVRTEHADRIAARVDTARETTELPIPMAGDSRSV